MFDDANKNDLGGQQRPPGNRIGKPKTPVFTLLAWVGISVVAALMLLNKQRSSVSAVPISQAELLEKLDSNQIASATVDINPQRLPFAEVTGSYCKAGKDGKVAAPGIPFLAHNVLLSGEVENKLVHLPQFVFCTPNTALVNLLWRNAPFFILGVLFWFFFLRRIKAGRPGS